MIGSATNCGVCVPFNFLSNATGNLISNNLIGLASDGRFAIPNGVGVLISTANNTVDDNFISGNGGDGILLTGSNATGNVISNNQIGTRANLLFCGPPPFPPCTGSAGLPNGSNGVRIESGASHAFVVSNTIAYNTGTGISVASGLGNNLVLNAIYANGNYGIDLTGSGLNDNDAAPGAQSLPNRGLNFPVITRAYGGMHHGWIEGALGTTNGVYLIQTFANSVADPTGYGEGEAYVGLSSANITNAPSGNNGSASFTGLISAPNVNLQSHTISTLARDNASGNTSEFSAWVTYNCDVIFSDGFEGAPSEACPVLQ